MWNRLLMGAAGLVAGTLVATPAVLGLSGNSSFSRDIQVPVPSGAHQADFVDPQRPDDTVTPRPEPVSRGEDRGRGGSDDGPRHDLGDDHGGRSGSDDHGGRSGSDDNGGRSGSDDNGGDDSGGHGGGGHG